MEENKSIPKGVIDIEAYEEVQRLAKHAIIQNPIYTTNDGLELNLGMMPHILRKKIEHLPKVERIKIEKLKELYFKINNNLTIQKRKAYGKKQGRGSSIEDGGSILEVRKEELLEFFGRMFTVEELVKIVNMEWGIPISKAKLYEFKLKYSEEIKKRVDNYQISFHNVRLGIKKSRLEELSEIYRVQKDIWDNNKKREDLRIVLGIIEQFRKEAEGDRLTIEGKLDIKYEQNIQVHLMKEVFATTNLKEIILGRVAAKMGINPVKLIYALNNSYYKKYSNVLGDFDETEASTADLPYPSQLNYDFERIGKAFNLRDKLIEDAIIVDESENKNDVEKAMSLKEKLAAKLRNKSKDVENFKTKLDVMEQQKRDK